VSNPGAGSIATRDAAHAARFLTGLLGDRAPLLTTELFGSVEPASSDEGLGSDQREILRACAADWLLASGHGDLGFEVAARLADLPAYLSDRLMPWIHMGQHEALTTMTTRLVAAGNIPVERALLNLAWSAFAAGDFVGAQMRLPERITEMGNHSWSFAAEAALLQSLIRYCRGNLPEALTWSRLAQHGLEGESRDHLLMLSMMIQANVALHRRDRSSAESIWQQAAHIPVNDGAERAWRSAIHSIHAFAAGAYATASEAARQSLNIACDAKLGPHLAPLSAWLVLGSVQRDIGLTKEANESTESLLMVLEEYPVLPLQAEALALKTHALLDDPRNSVPDSLAALNDLITHSMAEPELQDQIDWLEAELRTRTTEITRARVIIDRMPPTPRRILLEAMVDAETRPSKTLAALAGGHPRWHRQRIDAELIKVRARSRDPHSASIHLWRALDLAESESIVRPFLDSALVAKYFSSDLLMECLNQTEPPGDDGRRQSAHLKKVLGARDHMLIAGPETHELSGRELEVLRAVADGGDFASIARALVLSRWTIRSHFYSACRKLGVSGREAALVRLSDIDRPRI
jgi:DNA-binding CsgD family transcriptional regulator